MRHAYTKTMYMHTLDGKPASYYDMHDVQALAFAGKGHRKRAAQLVPTLKQLRREQLLALACEWREYKGGGTMNRVPTIMRYGYVLVTMLRLR